MATAVALLLPITTGPLMYLAALKGTAIFAIAIVAAFAQDDPTDQAPKTTLADMQHLAGLVAAPGRRLVPRRAVW